MPTVIRAENLSSAHFGKIVMKFVFAKFTITFTLVLCCANFVFAQTESEKGIELYKQGKNKEAVAVLIKAGKKIKTDAEVWNYLGLAYTKDEAYKKAVKAFEKAVAIDARNATYQTNLAYVYFLSNKLDKARNASTQAIEINPKSANAYYIRGAANVWLGDNDNAVKDADKAISLNADYSQAYTLKSDALLANFGKLVNGGVKPRDAANLLEQAQSALETCLKNCRNNLQVESQKKAVDTLHLFTEYFSRNRNAQLSDTTDASSGQTIPSTADSSVTPLKILKKPAAQYSNNARENGISGTVRVAALFSENGRVTHILVLKSLGGGLTENAVSAAKQLEFEPATKDGKPISQVRIIEYNFNVR